MSDDDVRVISGLCRRLDGLPLAIDLGAARAATLGLRELAARVDERLELLAGARVALTSRSPTRGASSTNGRTFGRCCSSSPYSSCASVP
jgi:non-specific serine/threonine protein kinase